MSIALALYFFKESDDREVSFLRKSATKDALTALDNQGTFRKLARDWFQQAKLSGEPLSLIMIDFDDLKKYNDHFGHEEGNVALTNVASVLKENTRADDIVARYGGDEFVILMTSHLEDSKKIAKRICKEVSTLQLAASESNQSINISVSLGVASLIKSMNSIEDLIKAADSELYRAKNEGKNRIAVATTSDTVT